MKQFKPLGDRVLIKPIKQEETKTKSGIIISESMTQSQKVNGEVVTKVNCEASRGTCECGGVEGAGCGGGKETPVVNLSYKMYREFINKQK